MIHVLATINVAPGRRADVLTHFLAMIPAVRAEAGCLRYEPCLDVPVQLPLPTAQRSDTFVVVEAWESEAHLRAHLETPHVVAYSAAVADLVESVEVQVLGEVTEAG